MSKFALATAPLGAFCNTFDLHLAVFGLLFDCIYNPCALKFNILVSFADNLCKQFGSRTSLTKCQAWSGSKLFDTLNGISERLILQKLILKKSSKPQKKHEKLPSRQIVNPYNKPSVLFMGHLQIPQNQTPQMATSGQVLLCTLTECSSY